MFHLAAVAFWIGVLSPLTWLARDAQAGARLATSISTEWCVMGAILLAIAVLTSVFLVPT